MSLWCNRYSGNLLFLKRSRWVRILGIVALIAITIIRNFSASLEQEILHSILHFNNEVAFVRSQTILKNQSIAPSKNGSSAHVSFPGDYDQIPPRSRFAYAVLLVNIDLERVSYRVYLYNTIVSVSILRESNCTQDVVVLAQMRTEGPQMLPFHELQVLEQLGCRVRFLPASGTASSNGSGFHFGRSQMLKFHILDLVEYERVLYLDSDLMPLCNLDYLFYLSVDGNIKENMVVAWTGTPAIGAFFMLRPGEGEKQALDAIAQKVFLRGKFDPVQGWGHAIENPDRWVNLRGKEGHLWDFYAANWDQGLLYYWTKYYRKNVTVVTEKFCEHWAEEIDKNKSKIVMQRKTSLEPFEQGTCLWADVPSRFPRHRKRSVAFSFHPAYGGAFVGTPVYQDFVHFYAGFKPWAKETMEPDCDGKFQARSARQYFFHVLRKANQKFQLGIDFDNWQQVWNQSRSSSLEEEHRATTAAYQT